MLCLCFFLPIYSGFRIPTESFLECIYAVLTFHERLARVCLRHVWSCKSWTDHPVVKGQLGVIALKQSVHDFALGIKYHAHMYFSMSNVNLT